MSGPQGRGRRTAGTAPSPRPGVTDVPGEIRVTGRRDTFLHCKCGPAGMQTGTEEPPGEFAGGSHSGQQ